MRKDELFYPIGKRITFFREKKKMTVNKLATEAGLSQSHLRDIELENKIPSVETLYYICSALGLSLKEFFDDNTESLLVDNPIIEKIYHMNKKQRDALLAFLNTIE